MRLVLAILVFLLMAAAPSVSPGPLQLCPTPQLGPDCHPVELQNLQLQGREAFLVQHVEVDPAALPLDRPLAVRIIAMASAEVRWNGRVIGYNGRPGIDSASEEPGRFIADIPVPTASVRPGPNIMTARLSAHHLWLPVLRPVHLVTVMPYFGEELPGLSAYLPALLMLGALAAACIYFAASAVIERRNPAPFLLAAIAGVAMLQLAAEVSRAFIAYTYPWHLARVAVVALRAAIIAVLAAAYAAPRFAIRRQRRRRA